MLDEKYTGNGKVVLLAGGGKIYTDIAARFVRSERSLEEIVASPYSRQIVRNILESGHRAALEFDFFLFGVEGYSRVTETQLVRKRLASYLIKSGRAELGGKRRFSVVYPASVRDFGAEVTLPDGHTTRLTGRDLADLTRQWYDAGLEAGLPEEDLRYPGHGVQGHHRHERPCPAGLVLHPLLPQRPARDPPSGLADAFPVPQGRTGPVPGGRAQLCASGLLP